MPGHDQCAASPKVRVKSAPDESARTQAGKRRSSSFDIPCVEPGVCEPEVVLLPHAPNPGLSHIKRSGSVAHQVKLGNAARSGSRHVSGSGARLEQDLPWPRSDDAGLRIDLTWARTAVTLGPGVKPGPRA